MLPFVPEVVFNNLAQINHRLSRNQFCRKHIIQSRQYFLLNLTDSDAISCLFSRQFLYRKIRREIDIYRPRLFWLLTNDLFAKLWQEIIRREAQPELLAAVEIFARLRCNVANQFTFARSLKVDNCEIAQFQSPFGNFNEVSGLIAQTLKRSINFRLRNRRLLQ